MKIFKCEEDGCVYVWLRKNKYNYYRKGDRHKECNTKSTNFDFR